MRFCGAWGSASVFNSRQAGFADGILEATAGTGVDLILNTLGEEFLAENLALAGRQRQVSGHHQAHGFVAASGVMRRPDAQYHLLDLAHLLATEPEEIQSRLQSLFGRCAEGRIEPLPSRSFPLSEAKDAFRFMRSARHVGKILIQPRHEPRPTHTRPHCRTGNDPSGTVH